MGEIECDDAEMESRVKTVFYEVENKPKFHLMKRDEKKKKVGTTIKSTTDQLLA